jgi:hypothetical protein
MEIAANEENCLYGDPRILQAIVFASFIGTTSKQLLSFRLPDVPPMGVEAFQHCL